MTFSFSGEGGTSSRLKPVFSGSHFTSWSTRTASDIFLMPPAGMRVFLTIRLDWYVMTSVTRETVLALLPGREVGRGKVEAVPGTPLAPPDPELSSLRCELDITE